MRAGPGRRRLGRSLALPRSAGASPSRNAPARVREGFVWPGFRIPGEGEAPSEPPSVFSGLARRLALPKWLNSARAGYKTRARPPIQAAPILPSRV